jgi:hypothetical protein
MTEGEEEEKMLKRVCPELVSGFSMTIHFTGIVKPVRVAETRLVVLKRACPELVSGFSITLTARLVASHLVIFFLILLTFFIVLNLFCQGM